MATVKPDNEWLVRQGGLMRCCLATIDNSTEPASEGKVKHCLYCSSSVVLKDGAWEWKRE